MRAHPGRRKSARRGRSSSGRADTNASPKPRRVKMFRKMILSALLATGTVTGLTLTPTAADAQPVEYRHDWHGHRERFHRFEVLYLRGHCWENGGTFRD